jgi:2-methylcitrate dehydratase
MELHRDLGGRWQDIEKVDIETYTHAVECSADSRDKWNPTSRETADHSLPYCVAVALHRGAIWVDDFVPERIADPEVHALMQRIGVRATEPMDRLWPDAYPFRLTLTTKSGATLVREIHYEKVHPKNPLDDAEIEAKFHKLADGVLGGEAVDRALKVLWKFPELRNVSEVFEPFVLEGSR